jgi:hypothetical protein
VKMLGKRRKPWLWSSKLQFGIALPLGLCAHHLIALWKNLVRTFPPKVFLWLVESLNKPRGLLSLYFPAMPAYT